MSWWHSKCCGTTPPPCECECEHCADNEAPCCWKVVVADIEEDGCGECTALNGTYYLKQDPSDTCRWVAGIDPAVCGIGEIQLVVAADDTITVTLGDNEWQTDFGTPPECCDEHELPNTATAADCDATGSTATISIGAAENCPPCSDNPSCIPTVDGDGASVGIAVDLPSGWANGLWPPWCDCVNGIEGYYALSLRTLPSDAPCAGNLWEYLGDPLPPRPDQSCIYRVAICATRACSEIDGLCYLTVKIYIGAFPWFQYAYWRYANTVGFVPGDRGPFTLDYYDKFSTPGFNVCDWTVYPASITAEVMMP